MECHNTCQVECQYICQIECPVECQNICVTKRNVRMNVRQNDRMSLCVDHSKKVFFVAFPRLAPFLISTFCCLDRFSKHNVSLLAFHPLQFLFLFFYMTKFVTNSLIALIHVPSFSVLFFWEQTCLCHSTILKVGSGARVTIQVHIYIFPMYIYVYIQYIYININLSLSLFIYILYLY